MTLLTPANDLLSFAISGSLFDLHLEKFIEPFIFAIMEPVSDAFEMVWCPRDMARGQGTGS